MSDLTIEEHISAFEKRVNKLKKAGLRFSNQRLSELPAELTEEELEQIKRMEEDIGNGKHFPMIASSDVLVPLKP